MAVKPMWGDEPKYGTKVERKRKIRRERNQFGSRGLVCFDITQSKQGLLLAFLPAVLQHI